MSKRTRTGLISAVAFALLTAAAGAVQMPSQSMENDETQSQIAGVWRGNSVCAVENSPCHNEVNVYRISEAAGRPGWFSVTGSKIVDGKEIVMGTGDWKYEQGSHALTTETPAGKFRLVINRRKMDGSLTLKDGTVFRRIYLQKEN